MIVTVTTIHGDGKYSSSIHNGGTTIGGKPLMVPTEMFISENVRIFVLILHDTDGGAIAGLAFDMVNDIVSMETLFDVKGSGLEYIANLINGVDWLAYVMMAMDSTGILEVELNNWGLIIDTSPYETIHVDGPIVRLRAPKVLN